MRSVRALGATVAAVVLVLAGIVLATPAKADAEGDFVARINAARADRGLGGLAVDGELTGIARRWSQRMAADQRLSHNPNLSKEVTQDWEKLAENVGFGPDVATIHDAFMNSSAHRANILDAAMTHVGVGVVVDGSGQLWVTEVFMRLRSGGGSTATTAPPAPPPTAAPTPTTARPRPAPTTTAAPPPTAPPTTEAPPPPPPEPEPVPEVVAPPPPPPVPSARLMLVLDRLVALDQGH